MMTEPLVADQGDPQQRIRILEFQVAHLRHELEALEARHHQAIYSVAWHMIWPVRKIEQFFRRTGRRRLADSTPILLEKGVDAAPVAARLRMSREQIAARIARRI